MALSIVGLLYLYMLWQLFYIRTGYVSRRTASQLKNYMGDINSVAQKYDVPANLIAAVIMVESAGNPLAKGAAGERGLMQLTPGAIDDVNENFGTNFTFDSMFAAKANMLAGTHYLKLQLKRFTLTANAIRAYNAGEKGAKSGKSFDYLQRVKRYA